MEPSRSARVCAGRRTVKILTSVSSNRSTEKRDLSQYPHCWGFLNAEKGLDEGGTPGRALVIQGLFLWKKQTYG